MNRRHFDSHVAIGVDGRIFVELKGLSKEVRVALRGRRRFVGVELRPGEVDRFRDAIENAAFKAMVELANDFRKG